VILFLPQELFLCDSVVNERSAVLGTLKDEFAFRNPKEVVDIWLE
jgi:hypothetical protein